MALRLGLIGGTGLYSVPGSEEIQIEAPGGPVSIWRSRLGAHELFFLPRHGADHRHVPLRVPHADHVHALRAAHCDYLIGINNVGSLKPDLRPGTWAVPNDFIDLHHAQRATLFADQPVHVDFTDPYCPTLRPRLAHAAGAPEVTYVGVDGPRFETPVEVRRFSAMGGHVVGMTGVPEAVLAHEAGLCYASLCFVGNFATGLGPPLDPRSIQIHLAKRQADVLAILRAATRGLPAKKSCQCQRLAPTLTSTRGKR